MPGEDGQKAGYHWQSYDYLFHVLRNHHTECDRTYLYVYAVSTLSKHTGERETITADRDGTYACSEHFVKTHGGA